MHSHNEGREGTFPQEEGYRSRRAQAVFRAGSAMVLAVAVIALAGYKPWASEQRPEGDMIPWREASDAARTSWYGDDLGDERREESGLLQEAMLDDTNTTNITTSDEQGNEQNFSFPIMPATEEEWESWERMKGTPKECVPVIDEEVDPEGNIVQTFHPDCSEEAIEKYHEEIAAGRKPNLRVRSKAGQALAATSQASLRVLKGRVTASKGELDKAMQRLKSLLKSASK